MSGTIRPGMRARNAALYRERAERARTEHERDEYTHYAEQLENALAAAERCRRCGRRLENEESKKRGVGPECLQEIRAIEGTPTRQGATP